MATFSSPYKIEGDVWYDIDSGANRPVILESYRPANTTLTIEWNIVDKSTSYLVLFSWDMIPYYSPPNVFYTFYMSNLPAEGEHHYITGGGLDIYHCAKYVVNCVLLQSEERVGPLYISIINMDTSTVLSMGSFKFSYRAINAYIKPAQLNALQTLWSKCCEPIYKDLSNEPIGIINPYEKSYCDWSFKYKDSLDTEVCASIPEIECDSSGNIINLDLENRGIQCSNAFDYIAPLNSLNTLLLGNNKLSDNINKLILFPKIIKLALYNNNFYGELPCSLNRSIELLDISLNSITGTIPECYDIFESLETFNVKYIQFNSQPFPKAVYKWKNIKNLILKNINIKGTIENKLPSSIKYIDLSNNYITGTIPSSIMAPDVEYIDVSSNELTGFIPPIPKTVTLGHFNDNKLSGDIPSIIKNVKTGSHLDLSYNEFTGYFPQEIITLSQHSYINVRGNNFVCDSKTQTWSKTLIYAERILNMDKCGYNQTVPDSYNPPSTIVLTEYFTKVDPASIVLVNVAWVLVVALYWLFTYFKVGNSLRNTLWPKYNTNPRVPVSDNDSENVEMAL